MGRPGALFALDLGIAVGPAAIAIRRILTDAPVRVTVDLCSADVDELGDAGLEGCLSQGRRTHHVDGVGTVCRIPVRDDGGTVKDPVNPVDCRAQAVAVGQVA